MILNAILWYAGMLLAGGLAFPVAARLLPFLPDRGWALSKPLGLLIWAYAYWLLTVLQVTPNGIGAVLLGLAALVALSLWCSRAEMWAWLGGQRRLVIVTEGLFALAFIAWLFIRATYPDASGTEKPMEMAFINAILHSPSFPAHDPWLAGYAISYYYFGYIMVAMLAQFAGAAGEVAFNLGVAGWFALSAAAAYGLAYNLLALGAVQKAAKVVYSALLAPLFLLILSNLVGLLEVLHAEGIFWQQRNGTWQSPFWQWLGVQELINPPSLPLQFAPIRAGGIWWWRASRVLQDFDLKGGSREVIDEFPFFSYLLGDLHPHVLSMPFVLLAVGVALNLYLRLSLPDGEAEFAPLNWFRRADTWLAAVIFGGLAFLNTWDFPIYLALFGAAYLLAAYRRQGWRWSAVMDTALMVVSMGIAGIVLYLPFYVGFQSQAGGLLPSLIFFTRGTHFWLMFAPLLLPIAAWLVWKLWAGRNSASEPRKNAWVGAVIVSGALVGGLWLASWGMGIIGLGRSPEIWAADAASSPLLQALIARLQSPGTWLTLLALVAVVWLLMGRLRQISARQAEVEANADIPPVHGQISAADGFVLLLVLLGAGLTLFPEFFYLRDQFGTRMNTIFKFYYQAWVVWALAGTYATVTLWCSVKRGWISGLWRFGSVALMVVSLIYPVFGLLDRTGGFKTQSLSLDAAHSIQQFQPDEWQAIQWLEAAPQGVLAEAVGGSYTEYARASTFSGQAAVLGWPGHESQWRGGAQEMGSRESDLELLYRSGRWDQIQPILQKYNIRYIYVGGLERGKYRVNEAAFKQNLRVAYQNAQVTIYQAAEGTK